MHPMQSADVSFDDLFRFLWNKSNILLITLLDSNMSYSGCGSVKDCRTAFPNRRFRICYKPNSEIVGSDSSILAYATNGLAAINFWRKSTSYLVNSADDGYASLESGYAKTSAPKCNCLVATRWISVSTIPVSNAASRTILKFLLSSLNRSFSSEQIDNYFVNISRCCI